MSVYCAKEYIICSILTTEADWIICDVKKHLNVEHVIWNNTAGGSTPTDEITGFFDLRIK